MVKTLIVLVVVLLFTVPAFAQGDYAYVETSFGYANMSFTDLGNGVSRHSGFVWDTALNLTERYAIQNYFATYGLGGGVSVLTDMPGGKMTTRRWERFAPYAVAGFGGARLTASGFSLGSMMSTRFGGGVDFPINDQFGIKFDVSRIVFHVGDLPTQLGLGGTSRGWQGHTNIAGSVMLRLLN